jgi:hypothetical protein
MTNHRLTPPPELVQLWVNEYNLSKRDLPQTVYVATRAAQWGADKELRDCRDQLLEWDMDLCKLFEELFEARRGYANLKKCALEAYDKLQHLFIGYGNDGPYIRYALEQLDDFAPGPDYPSVMTVLNADQHALIRRALEQLDD